MDLAYILIDRDVEIEDLKDKLQEYHDFDKAFRFVSFCFLFFIGRGFVQLNLTFHGSRAVHLFNI